MEEKPTIKFLKTNEKAKIPEKREEDAGYDLYPVYEYDPIFLYPGDIKLFNTKLKMEFPKEYVFIIKERGSTGSKGITTRSGIIDSGYRGELIIVINNTSNKLIIITDKEEEYIKTNFFEKIEGYEENYILYPQKKAIAQGILLYTPNPKVKEVKTEEELEESERKTGLLGSTGK